MSSSNSLVATEQRSQSHCVTFTPRISHALHQLAGPWAEQVAELFPFPHSDFLNRSSMWMHVAGLIFANPISSNRNARVVFDHHRDRDWGDAAFIGSPRFTADNVFVLKKLTLPLWTREEYRLFAPLLDCPRAVKLMKHADQITPSLVRMIAHLPAAFRVKKIVDFLLHEDESKLLSRLFDHRNDEDKKRIVSSLKSTKNRTDFWRKASQHFFHGFGEFPGVLVIDDDRFESVKTVQELIRTKDEFANCLNHYIFNCLAGQYGILVFRGDENAVISYEPRLGNRFVIDQIHLAKNEIPSDETITEIMSVLKNYGFEYGEFDPLQIYQTLDTRMHRLALTDHEYEAKRSSSKISELLDQVEQFRSVG